MNQELKVLWKVFDLLWKLYYETPKVSAKFNLISGISGRVFLMICLRIQERKEWKKKGWVGCGGGGGTTCFWAFKIFIYIQATYFISRYKAKIFPDWVLKIKDLGVIKYWLNLLGCRNIFFVNKPAKGYILYFIFILPEVA